MGIKDFTSPLSLQSSLQKGKVEPSPIFSFAEIHFQVLSGSWWSTVSFLQKGKMTADYRIFLFNRLVTDRSLQLKSAELQDCFDTA